MSVTPIISIDTQTEISNFLRNKLSGGEQGRIFFRRFSKLNNKNAPTCVLKHIQPYGGAEEQPVDELSLISDADRQRFISVHYDYFFGFTEQRSIREEPEAVKGKPIYLHSENYSELDIENCEFNFVSKPSVTPLKNDLILIYMTNKTLQDARGKKTSPKADDWCIISEQFFRAWTVIMYDWHESFDKMFSLKTSINREDSLKEKLFCNNKLMTNTWLKHKIAKEMLGLDFTHEESTQRYWHLRTESASRNWVDIYCALVLLARYGEVPCINNIPNTRGENEQKRTQWNLPENFVGKLLCNSVNVYKPTNKSISNINGWNVKFDNHQWWSFFNDIATMKVSKPLEVSSSLTNIYSITSAENARVSVTVESNTPINVKNAELKVKKSEYSFSVQLALDTDWHSL